jgi:hypothetical protein
MRPRGRAHLLTLALPLYPSLALRGLANASARTREKNKIIFLVFACWKREEKDVRFSIPNIPELRGLRGRSREKKKVFSA